MVSSHYMQILLNTVGLFLFGLELAHLVPFRVTGLIPEILDFGIRYRFAMSALFPSRNLAQKLSYAWRRRQCASIQEPFLKPKLLPVFSQILPACNANCTAAAQIACCGAEQWIDPWLELWGSNGLLPELVVGSLQGRQSGGSCCTRRSGVTTTFQRV